MKGGGKRRLGRALGNTVPALLTLFLILFTRVPFQDSNAGIFIPVFSLIFTYFFRLHFPEIARLWLVFLLGLLEDYLSGGYLGLTSLVLLIVAALFERQRHFFLQGSFASEIFIFAFFSLGISLLYWLLTSFIEATFVPVLPFFVQGLMTALVFPLYVFIIGRINRRFSV